MSDNGQGPKSGKVVGNGPIMVARGCQGSPEVPVDLKRGLQRRPRGKEGPPMARSGEIGGSPRLINSGVGGMAQSLNILWSEEVDVSLTCVLKGT